jgi:hypothetical protein
VIARHAAALPPVDSFCGDLTGHGLSAARTAASIHVLAISKKMSRSRSVCAVRAQSMHSSAYALYSFDDDTTRSHRDSRLTPQSKNLLVGVESVKQFSCTLPHQQIPKFYADRAISTLSKSKLPALRHHLEMATDLDKKY